MAAALLLGVTAPVYAQSVEQATANITPWSGWWWPAKTGDLVLGYRGEPGALVKHDQVDGKQASQWEQQVKNGKKRLVASSSDLKSSCY